MEHILNKEQFQKYQATFKQLSRSKQATAVDHILYNILRGKKRTHGFTPITNQVKLVSSCVKNPWFNFNTAFTTMNWHIRSFINRLKKGLPRYKSLPEYGIVYESSFYVEFCARYNMTLEEWETIYHHLSGVNQNGKN